MGIEILLFYNKKLISNFEFFGLQNIPVSISYKDTDDVWWLAQNNKN